MSLRRSTLGILDGAKPLDEAGGTALAAYSLRKLRDGYTGDALVAHTGTPFACAVTRNSATITVTSTTNLKVGMSVWIYNSGNTLVSNGTTITSIPTSTTFVISATIASGTGTYAGTAHFGYSIGFTNDIVSTTDVKFTNMLNQDTLITVRTWFDQSGNGRDVTQTVIANQPRIVVGGSFNIIDGLPSIFSPDTANFRWLRISGISDYVYGQATGSVQVVKMSADPFVSAANGVPFFNYALFKTATCTGTNVAVFSIGMSLSTPSASKLVGSTMRSSALTQDPTDPGPFSSCASVTLYPPGKDLNTVQMFNGYNTGGYIVGFVDDMTFLNAGGYYGRNLTSVNGMLMSTTYTRYKYPWDSAVTGTFTVGTPSGNHTPWAVQEYIAYSGVRGYQERAVLERNASRFYNLLMLA